MTAATSLKKYDLEMIAYALERARRFLDNVLIQPAEDRGYPFPWDDYKDIVYAFELTQKYIKSCRA